MPHFESRNVIATSPQRSASVGLGGFAEDNLF